MRSFDESDLIAYHLHELQPKQARALLQAMQSDPTLVAESVSIAAMLAEYKHHTPMDVDTQAMERNWNAVRHALPRVLVPPPPPLFRWRLPILAGAGLALAVPIFFAVHRPDGTELPQQNAPSQTAHAVVPTPKAIMRGLAYEAIAPRAPGTGRRMTHKTSPGTELFGTVTPASVQNLPLQAITPHAQTTEPVARAPLFTPAPTTPAVSPASSSSVQSDTSADSAASQKKQNARTGRHHASDTDLTLSMGGTFIATRGNTANGLTRSEGATHSISAIASFHQQFRPLVGYRVTASYTRPDFHYIYSYAAGPTSQQGINGRVYELAGTYVVRGPHRGRVTTYVEAGAGVMAFLPTIANNGTDYNISPAGIVGVSADVPITRHFGVHAAYRAQAFPGPDFHANTTIYPLANSNILISQEPSVGITYRFTQKQQ